MTAKYSCPKAKTPMRWPLLPCPIGSKRACRERTKLKRARSNNATLLINKPILQPRCPGHDTPTMIPRTNPFRAQRIDALSYRLQDMTWEELLVRLARLKFRGAITGPHGHGKSTLLDAL